jgi:peptidoglycan/LPS O-acetylase OafA/YrhL
VSQAPHGATLTYWPALDGVRALAVTAVLLFHGGVAWLPGGFLGVDAFFVLSGFLITSLLLTEYGRTGRIRLGHFWLRRARRLLPALLLLLLFVVAVFPGVLPPFEVSLLRGDAFAALGYVANWRMIYRGDDYFTQTAAPSPLQHTWSLGIEEQFYVVWPLLVVALLAFGLRRAFVGLCVLGAAISAVLAGLLFDPLAVNRAYFGTDTRAQALLIGCALAAGLMAVRHNEPAAARRTNRDRIAVRPGPQRLAGPATTALTIAAIVAVIVIAWLWTHASGSGSLLYHGGLAAGGIAVAVVLAHAVLLPSGFLARALSVAPLVWLGRISYGVYLWHWPLFALLNAGRTGLSGTALLVVRLAATIAVSVVSYVLVEQPVRTGRWPWPRTRPKIALSPAGAGLGATAAVGATAVFILVATIVPTRIAVVPIVAIPSLDPSALTSGRSTPMQRENRKPGLDPRITFFGDSVSWSLGTYIQEVPGLSITTQAMPGCGIARLPDIVYIGEPHTNYPDCNVWDEIWRLRVLADDPDVAVVLLDRWELMDRKLGEEYMHVGQPMMDAYLSVELEYALSIVGANGAHIVLLTAPYTHRWERPDGELFGEDKPERVDAWNRLLRNAASKYPDTVTVIDLNKHVCPEGKFTWNIGDLQIRSDGLHFTEEGVQEWIAPWLVPQLANLALYGPYYSVRGD